MSRTDRILRAVAIVLAIGAAASHCRAGWMLAAGYLAYAALLTFFPQDA